MIRSLARAGSGLTHVPGLTNDPAVRWGALTFLVLRLFTAISAFLLLQFEPTPIPGWQLTTNQSSVTYLQALSTNNLLYAWLEPWHRWDTAWYTKIAIQGYPPNDVSVVFPPLYPLLIRLITLIIGSNYVLASIIVSNISCLVFMIMLFKLIELEWGDKVLARRVLICLAAAPSAFYLVAGYSEALFMALTISAFYGALRRQWLVVGGLTFLAGLTRTQGAALCIPLGWIAYVQMREGGWRAHLVRLPVLVGGPLGVITYLAYLHLNRLYSLDVAYYRGWHMETQWPWVALLDFLGRVRASGYVPSWEVRNVIALVAIVILGVVVLFKLRPAYRLYVWTTLAIILLRYHAGAQFEGMVRYTIVMFPCFIAAAIFLRQRWLFMLIVAVSVLAQLYLLYNFIHWKWVA